MIQFAKLDWKGEITVVVSSGFLSRSLIAEHFREVEPWRSSTWTSLEPEQTYQVLQQTFLPPKKIPTGFVDIFDPPYNHLPKKVLHRSWDFDKARYVDFRSFLKARTPL